MVLTIQHDATNATFLKPRTYSGRLAAAKCTVVAVDQEDRTVGRACPVALFQPCRLHALGAEAWQARGLHRLLEHCLMLSTVFGT